MGSIALAGEPLDKTGLVLHYGLRIEHRPNESNFAVSDAEKIVQCIQPAFSGGHLPDATGRGRLYRR